MNKSKAHSVHFFGIYFWKILLCFLILRCEIILVIIFEFFMLFQASRIWLKITFPFIFESIHDNFHSSFQYWTLFNSPKYQQNHSVFDSMNEISRKCMISMKNEWNLQYFGYKINFQFDYFFRMKFRYFNSVIIASVVQKW